MGFSPLRKALGQPELHGCFMRAAGPPPVFMPMSVATGDIEGRTIMLKHYLPVLLAGAVALAAFSPAQAQTESMSAARAAAIHECAALAGRYAETTYGNTEFYLYRSCMARHGQIE